MSDQGIKSRPRYQPLAPDEAGRHHLLVVDGAEVPAEALAEGVTPSAFEVWTVARRSAVPAAPAMEEAPGAVRTFRSAPHLFSALEERLARETMGLRLYAAGTEPFLWMRAASARQPASRPWRCASPMWAAARGASSASIAGR